jgi:hypothetical protein
MNLAMSKPGVRRCVLLLAWCLFFAPFAAAQSSVLDKYGGAKALKCAKATGWFHTEKINSHWWLCTSLGNAFYSLGVQQAAGSIHGNWDPANVNRRLQSWGFNTVQIGAYAYDLPVAIDSRFPLDSNSLYSQPVKMPFVVNTRPALYAMSNPVMGPSRFLTNPVKSMFFVHSPFYTGYIPYNGIADYYDSGFQAWLHDDLTLGRDDQWNRLNGSGSVYLNYIIGIASDDGDDMHGFGAGPDFSTTPSGYNDFNLAIAIAGMSPLETAGSHFSWVYADTLIHSKMAFRNSLATQYSTITALNTAWGSSYTTFDSSGACVGSQPIACASSFSADSVGTGNGSTLTFSAMLTRRTLSEFSLQVLVAGTPVAGEDANNPGNLWGPNASGTINYSSGALSITFAAGHAPANGTAITATYIANGWNAGGTGFLDEDNRSAHNNYMGGASANDWIYMADANANFKADMNAFAQQIAGQYFLACRTEFKAAYPNVLYLGPDTLGTYGVPSSAPVLRAAGQYIDAFFGGGMVSPYTQAQLDYIETNYGDKPYFNTFYSAANPDSALSAYPNQRNPGAFTTQTARGQAYVNLITAQLQTAHTTAGNYPYLGVLWWEYADNVGEKLDWGITTPLDNAYDGHEAATGSVPCSAPIQAYTCGGEAGNYGDLITSVKAANLLWTNFNP